MRDDVAFLRIPSATYFFSSPSRTRILLSSPPFPISGNVAGFPVSSRNACEARSGTPLWSRVEEREHVESGSGAGCDK